jgi:hypothetical protein
MSSYKATFAMLSCGIALSYMWMIPYLTDFSFPTTRKETFPFFFFNSSLFFDNYVVYEGDVTKEYNINVKRLNLSCLSYTYMDGNTRWIYFPSVVGSSFSIKLSSSFSSSSHIIAMRIECNGEVDFIFHPKDSVSVLPLLRKDDESFVCPKQSKCTYDVSKPIRQILTEDMDAQRTMRTFHHNISTPSLPWLRTVYHL